MNKNLLLLARHPVLTALSWGLRKVRPRSQGWGCMAVVLGVSLFLAGAARADAGQSLYWQCQPPSSAVPNGSYCPVGLSYPLPVSQAATGGGGSTYRSVALTSTALAVKASAGTVSMVHVVNLEGGAATCWVHFYNVAAASVVVGTTVPIWSQMLAASTAQTIPFNVPIQFSTAISVAATTTAGGATACSPILTLTEAVYK